MWKVAVVGGCDWHVEESLTNFAVLYSEHSTLELSGVSYPTYSNKLGRSVLVNRQFSIEPSSAG